MSMIDLPLELQELIGSFIETGEGGELSGVLTPVMKFHGIFNQTLALRGHKDAKNHLVPRRFSTVATMINAKDFASGSILFYAISQGAPVHHIAEIVARCPGARSVLDTQQNSVLHMAAAANYPVELLEILCESADTWTAKKLAVNSSKMTPIHMALEAGADYEVIRFLLDPDRKVVMMATENGDLPLHCAIERVAGLRVVQLLIGSEEGDALWWANEQDNIPLHLAGKFGVSEIGVIHLLKGLEMHILESRNTGGHTPLYLAVESGQDVSVIALLIDVDKNLLVRAGLKPLHLAVSVGACIEVIKILIDPLKTVLRSTQLGYYPLHIAIQHRANVAILKLLLDDDRVCVKYNGTRGCNSALHLACETGVALDVIEFLLEMNAEALLLANSYYSGQQTPLHLAVCAKRGVDGEYFYMSLESIEYLVRFNSDTLTAVNAKKETPLHFFLTHSAVYSVERVKSLIDDSKTVLTMTDCEGEVPLHKAIRHGTIFPGVIPALIDTDKNCLLLCGKHGCPLQLAVVSKWNVENLQALVDSLGKVFRLRGRESNTALHESVLNKADDAVVRFLVKSDAGVLKLLNSRNCTPLHAAVDNHVSASNTYYGRDSDTISYHTWSLDMIFLLAHTDTSVLMLRNMHGDTALSSAVQRGFKLEVLQYLIDSDGEVLRMTTKSSFGLRTPLHHSIRKVREKEMPEYIIRFLVDHLGGQDALILRDNDGDTPLHSALKQELSPQIIRHLAYKSMPPVSVAWNGQVIPTLAIQHVLGMQNRMGRTPLHIVMKNLWYSGAQGYGTVLYLVQLYAEALGTICLNHQTPLVIAVCLALHEIIPVSFLETLVQSYPQALVVNDLRGDFCKFPLVYALTYARNHCVLDVETLIRVLGLLIDGDRVVMRRHRGAPTPSELAGGECLDPRVVEFLRSQE